MRLHPARFRRAALAAALLLVARLPGQEPTTKPAFDVVTLADGVYAFISTKSGVASGNTLAVVGDDGVLVVDAGSFPSITRQIIGEIRKRTDKPVRFLVHTHWHEDHWLGNGEYRKAFPDVVLVSTAFTRQRMEKEVPESLQKMIDGAPQYEKPYKDAIAQGKKMDGTPLDEATRQRYEEQIADFEWASGEYRQVVPVMPDLTFEQEIRIHLGKREVAVRFLGRGNTAGDAVTYIPDARVVAAGDLIVLPEPFSFGSYPGEWIETLRKLLALDAVAIVPGHGPVLRDQEYPKTLIRLLESLRAQVGEAVRSGKTLEETRQVVNLEGFDKELSKGDPRVSRMFQAYFVTPAVERAYQEAKGTYAPE